MHKMGSLNNVENYRGISLLTVLENLFTRILNNRLTQWAEDYYIYMYMEARAGDVPRSASYGVYITQLIRFARVSSHVDNFNRQHFDIVSKYNVGLKTLLLQGLSEPEFYGDLVYKFRKIIGKNDFPYHFKKIVVRYKKIGYNTNVLRQTACLVVNPIKVNSFVYLLNCTTVGRTSD